MNVSRGIRSCILFLFYAALLCFAFAKNVSADDVPRLVINGQANPALGELGARLRANPNDAEARNLLCRVYYQEERWDSAASECQRAASLDPKNSRYQLWLGRAYGQKAERANFLTAATLAPKVRDAFERAVQLDPNNLAARADLSEFYIEAPAFMGGGSDKAEAQVGPMAQINVAVAAWLRGRIAEHRKQFDVAEREFKRAIEESPDPGPHFFDLASFYRRIDRLDDMEATVNRMAATSTKDGPEFFDAAGLLLRAGRNFPGAISLLRRYLVSDAHGEEAPTFQAQYRLGMLLEKSGDVEGARTAYQSALALAADYAPAQTALRRLQQANH